MEDDAKSSRRLEHEVFRARPHLHECFARVAQLLRARFRELEMTLRAPAALRRRLAETRHEQSLFLEPPQREVYRRHRDLAARAPANLVHDLDGVALAAKMQQRDEHEVLDVTEGSPRH